MPTIAQDPERIVTLDGFLDHVIRYANPKVDHVTSEFMSMLHTRILRALRAAELGQCEAPNDNVLRAYFRMYTLLRQETVSRSRIISTAEAVVDWLR